MGGLKGTITRHAQGYHHTTVCPPFGRVCMQVTRPSERPSPLPLPQDTQTTQRPHPSGEESRSGLSDSLWGMWQGIHLTDQPGTRPTAERTQEGPDVRKPSTINSSRACHGGDARDTCRSSTLMIKTPGLGSKQIQLSNFSPASVAPEIFCNVNT